MTKQWLRSVAAIPPAVTVRLVPYVWAIPIIAVAVMVMPCGWMVLMELLVCASVGAVPVFVLLRICKTLPMCRVVLVIELLVELLVLQMIIKVVKEVLVLGWIMGKGRSSRRTEDECSRNGQRSSHGRFLGRDAFGAWYRFHDTLPSTPQP